MKKINAIFLVGITIAVISCKGNPNTTSGDSTGTGAGGSRVPGLVSRDTTAHDSAGSAKQDTVKK